jgi:hypothetical protein
LRIRDVFPDPDPDFYLSRIPDLGSSDPQTTTKEEGEKLLPTFFLSHKYPDPKTTTKEEGE